MVERHVEESLAEARSDGGGERDVPVGVHEIILAQTRACASRSSIQEVSGSENKKPNQTKPLRDVVSTQRPVG